MAIDFYPNGRIVCNFVKYNSVQLPNLVSDNCFMCSDVWTFTDSTRSEGMANGAYLDFYPGVVTGLKTFGWPNGFARLSNLGSSLDQEISLVKGHLYFLSFIATVGLYNGQLNVYVGHHLAFERVSASSNGCLNATLFTYDYDITEDDLLLLSFVKTTTDSSFTVSKVILIDLTAGFGVYGGKQRFLEPFGYDTDAALLWCVNHIREMGAGTGFYTGFQMITPLITRSNYSSIFSLTGARAGMGFAYPYSPRAYFPTSCFYRIMGSSTSSLATIQFSGEYTYDPSSVYYIFADICPLNSAAIGKRIEFRWGELSYSAVIRSGRNYFSLPSSTDLNQFSAYKRHSFVIPEKAASTSFTAPVSLTFYNEREEAEFDMLDFSLVRVSSFIYSELATGNNKSERYIFTKSWCDTSVSGYSDSIIHVLNPLNTAIDFTSSHDVVCNDLAIARTVPSRVNNNSSITFNYDTGIISCMDVVCLEDE